MLGPVSDLNPVLLMAFSPIRSPVHPLGCFLLWRLCFIHWASHFLYSFGSCGERKQAGMVLEGPWGLRMESPQKAVSRCRQVWGRKSDAHFLEASPAPTQHECINNSLTFRIASRQPDRPLQGDWFCHNHVGRQAHVPFTVWEPRRERMPGSTCWLRKVGLHGSVSP